MLQDPVGVCFSYLYGAGATLSSVPGTELWSQYSRRSLSIVWSTEDGALGGGWNALHRTERSTEDGTFDRGLSALQRMERSTEDGGALLNPVLSTEDIALNAGRNCQLRTE